MRTRINGGLIGAYQTPGTALTSTNRSAGEAAQLSAGGAWPGSTFSNPNLPPTITSVVITDSSYNNLDDTAVDTAGGYMKIIGTNFAQNPILYFNGDLIANSWVSSTEVRVQLPANSAGTGITFMLFNSTTSGGTIFTTGKTYSGVPSTTNSSPIAFSSTTISVQFVGSGDSPFVFSSTNVPAGTSLSSSGLLTGTLAEGTYSFSVTVDDAQLQTTTQTYSLTVSLSDTYWYLTTLALTANTAVTGNTFIADFSLNNQDVTVVADTRASPYNPYQTGYYSNYFDGTGDYLNAGSSVPAFGTSAYTVEFWVYPISLSSVHVYIRNSSTGGWQVYYDTTSGLGIASVGTAGFLFAGLGAVVANQWNHIAICRNSTASNDTRNFVNGVLKATGTDSTNWTVNNPLVIGANSSGTEAFNGYMSNVRIIKGTALYTAAFTPSTTPLVAVSGTSLLTCQSNRLIDASLNNVAITKNGDTTVVPANPFTTRYDYTVSYYSTYFDGSGDYITLPSNSVLTLSGDFTVEFWTYATVTSNSQSIWVPTSPAADRSIQVDGTSANWVYYDGTANRNFGSFVLGTWTHLALVRTGTTIVGYKDGVQGFSATDSGTLEFSGQSIGYRARTTAGNYYNGYVSNLRIVKGQVLYTTTFTPSTTPLTTTSQGATAVNVSLLTCQNSTLIDNSTNAFAITSTGQAQPQPVNPFSTPSFNSLSATIPTSGSAYFDGTGDYLSIPYKSAIDVGTGDFTLECWVYKMTSSSDWRIAGGPNSAGFFGEFSNQIGFGISAVEWTAYYAGKPIPLNQWSHVAWSRSNNTMYVFINGVLAGSTSVSGKNYGLNNGSLLIGSENGGSLVTGYISNFRLIKGTGIYTSNFYPSLTPLTAVTNTQLLTCQYNGASNNSQLRDASSFQNLITRAGNASQGTANPFGDNWSMFCAGTGGAQVPANSSYTIGTNDFTMEFWVYISTATTNSFASSHSTGGMFTMGPASAVAAPAVVFNFNASGGASSSYTASTTVQTITINTWNHIAISRVSGTVYFYINGVRDTTTWAASAINIGSYGGAKPFYLGAGADASNYFPGYLSNFRHIVGTGIYSGATITVPTSPLTWVANTVILTLQDNRLIDNTSIKAAVAAIGSGMTIQKFSPFRRSLVTSASYSVYFDGTGDYISVPYSAAISLSTGDFTIECWSYSSGVWFTNYMSSGVGIAITGTIYYLSTDGSTWNIANGVSIGTWTANQWNHFAFVRNGSVFTPYVNGVAGTTSSTASAITTNGQAYGIGNNAQGNTGPIGHVSNFRIVKGTAVYTAAFTPPTSALTAIANTALLTCQSTTIIDNSTNAITLTVAGNTITRKFNPFGYTSTVPAATSWSPTVEGGSVYCDGDGDSLSVTNSAAIDAFGTSPLTMECWVYITSLKGYQAILCKVGSADQYGIIIVLETNNTLSTYVGNGAWSVAMTGAVTPTINQWHHIALTRDSSNVWRLFYDGSVANSTTNSISVNSYAYPVYIGKYPYFPSYASTKDLSGYISNVRIVKGTAAYTGPFIPPTAPASITAGTSLLLDANPSVTDWTMSTNLESVADAKLSIQTPYAGTYYSNYFDGTGDYLSIADNASIDLPGDFTIEFWVNVDSGNTSLSGILSHRDQASWTDGTDWAIRVDTSAVKVGFGYDSAGNYYDMGTYTVGTWSHHAITRVGTAIKTFKNGTQVATATNSGTFSSTEALRVGRNISGYDYKGYVSNVRIVKGTALYTAAFTPSTTPLTAVSGTSVLTCQSRTFIDNSANAFTITRNGDVAVRVQNPFTRIADYSVYFDGTGDYLKAPSSPNYQFGTGDFTIEFWVYLNTVSGNQILYDNRVSAGVYPTIYMGTSTIKYYTNSADRITGGTLNTGQWYHIALSRANGSTKLFVDGTQSGSTYTDTNSYLASALTVGSDGMTPGSYLNGYITEMRVTRGYARYTTTFTPNTSSEQFKLR